MNFFKFSICYFLIIYYKFVIFEEEDKLVINFAFEKISSKRFFLSRLKIKVSSCILQFSDDFYWLALKEHTAVTTIHTEKKYLKIHF